MHMKKDSSGEYYVEDLPKFIYQENVSLEERGRRLRQRTLELRQHRELSRYAWMLNDARALMKKSRTWYGKRTYTVEVRKTETINQSLGVLESFFTETHTKTWKHLPTDEEILDFIKTIHKPKWT